MRFYVAGPMRGQPDHGFPTFYRAEQQLKSLEHEAVLPIEDGDLSRWGDPTKPYSAYMKRDITMLAECDGIVLLTGWRESIGATFEARCALEFDLPAFRISMTGPETLDVVLAPVDIDHLKGAV